LRTSLNSPRAYAQGASALSFACCFFSGCASCIRASALFSFQGATPDTNPPRAYTQGPSASSSVLSPSKRLAGFSSGRDGGTRGLPVSGAPWFRFRRVRRRKRGALSSVTDRWKERRVMFSSAKLARFVLPSIQVRRALGASSFLRRPMSIGPVGVSAQVRPHTPPVFRTAFLL
jgi:hypothetical protein